VKKQIGEDRHVKASPISKSSARHIASRKEAFLRGEWNEGKIQFKEGWERPLKGSGLPTGQTFSKGIAPDLCWSGRGGLNAGKGGNAAKKDKVIGEGIFYEKEWVTLSLFSSRSAKRRS